MIVRLKIPAIPVAQPRQQHRVVTAGGKPFASNYTPQKHPVNAFKAACQLVASQAYQGEPLKGPLGSRLIFVMPRPAGKPSWIKRDSFWFKVWKEGGRVPHISKPDRDNLMKSVCDALNGLLFADDALLHEGAVEKWVAASDEQPHVVIEVWDE